MVLYIDGIQILEKSTNLLQNKPFSAKIPKFSPYRKNICSSPKYMIFKLTTLIIFSK